MKVYAFDSVDWVEAEKNGLTKQKTVAAVKKGLDASANLLPTLSKYLNIAVRPHSVGIIQEYGTGARTHDSDFIEVVFDKSVPYGVAKTLESLRQSVFHEANHAARWNIVGEDYRLLEGVIFEGLATVFGREYAGYRPLYGEYEDDVTMQKWLSEIIAAKEDWSRREELFFDNSDGRRWIGYKAGAWVIDKAIENSGKSVIEFTTFSADEIIDLAKLEGHLEIEAD